MMETKPIEESDFLSSRNSPPHKRGRGRPRGSIKKNVIYVKELENNVRTSKKVDFFSPEQPIRPKSRKRGRPKKIRIPGRPRKIPLTPEEEAERILLLSRKRKLSKPLGRPRIHARLINSQIKRGRGRPRKTETSIKVIAKKISEEKLAGFQKVAKISDGTPRKRGRPHGSFKKKRGRPLGFSPVARLIDGVPIKRGRPPGSGVKLQLDASETPRKRGRPPGSGNKIKVFPRADDDGPPKKRGRPPGSVNKVKIVKLDTYSPPRKRGRPPGSGIKVHMKSHDTNGTPRKRGRPKGSGKAKSVNSEIEHADLSSSSSVASVTGQPSISSVVSGSAQPRKRGRPKKVKTQEVSISVEDLCKEEDDPPSPKQARSSSASDMEDAEDQNSSENEADHTEETFNNTEKDVGELRAKQTSFKDVYESNSKKNVFSRVGGKSQKKK